MNSLADSVLDASSPVVNIAAYKFVALDDLPVRRRALKERCLALGLKGTILLSPEGLNLFLAGSRTAIDGIVTDLRSDPLFADLTVKESPSGHQPFNRMLVRLKKEIIAFGVDGIDPRQATSPKIAPETLRQWLDEGRPLTLLDTRNDYEVALGTFRESRQLNIRHFRDFPAAVNTLPPETKSQPLVMFCTGGIRCEKAGPLMQREGFEQVYQLDGGILKYFEDCGGAHWDGECFVFDQRVAVAPDLSESETQQCFVCQASLSVEDCRSDRYLPGQSCPHCYQTPTERMQQVIAARHHRLQATCHPLPGSAAYDNRRPLNVPQRFDHSTLLDFLDGFHPHIGRDVWRQACDNGRVVYQDAPANADKIVRAGERYAHLIPATIEPDVASDVRILYEDDWLVVVDKPAPLPMHPCGRFNRNTLAYFLDRVYHPQKLRAAHRLDANTSGVVVFSRTRTVARTVQRQFEDRDVAKTYVARVVGQPARDAFVCDTPIGVETAEIGIRMPDPDGLAARTEFRTLSRLDDGTTLIEARPVTGRTNQIRAHLWDLAMPIYGDPAYLPDRQIGTLQTLNKEDPPLCLHAASIRLTHPDSGATCVFEAELPDWARRAGRGDTVSP